MNGLLAVLSPTMHASEEYNLQLFSKIGWESGIKKLAMEWSGALYCDNLANMKSDNLANMKSSRQKIAEYLQRSSGFETWKQTYTHRKTWGENFLQTNDYGAAQQVTRAAVDEILPAWSLPPPWQPLGGWATF